MRFIPPKTIELKRELSDLDTFAVDFTKILSKYVSYVIVSGYVSILLGRARVSEDIDIVIPRMEKEENMNLFSSLTRGGFYCLNTSKTDEMLEYLQEGISLRFARMGKVIPNMEMKWAKNVFDDISLRDALRVKIGNESLSISPLELQIAYKEQQLKSPKDLEDAHHLRMIAASFLNTQLLNKYERMLHDFS